MKIKVLYANWRQVGSVQDRDGSGEDYDKYEVGKNGVVEIEELFSEAIPNYTVHYENNNYTKIFNPNHVEYVYECW